MLMRMMQAVPGSGGKDEGGESLTREEMQEQERLRWMIDQDAHADEGLCQG